MEPRLSDITAVINLHREGALAAASLESLLRAATFARSKGVTVDCIAALDRPDDATKAIVAARAESGIEVLQLDLGDLGAARNAAVQAAQSNWIAFLDGDDLWELQWLAEAFRMASSDSREIVWHPEVNLYFGDRMGLMVHIDMEDKAFDLGALAVGNYWTALCFARQSLLARTPYPETDLHKRIGFEDWGWNIAAIEAGALHKVVKGTGHAIRTRRGSLAQTSVAHRARSDISGLFRYHIRRS